MFAGFYRPKANFFKLPNDWFDLWLQTRRQSGQSRIVGLLKAAEYTLKWSWGYRNYDRPVRISYRNFQFGMLRGGCRHDCGTGLSSRGVQNALTRLLDLNILERHEHESSQGSAYLPHLQPPQEDEDAFLDSVAHEGNADDWEGFALPKTNYFEVPAIWTDLTRSVTSAVVILAVEYFFRHTWGWHRNHSDTRPAWMPVEEVAAGRLDRTGERYDDGTGYSVRSVRPALEQAVRRGWLVWRTDERTGRKQYALHLKGMVVSDQGEWLGHQDAAETNHTEPAPEQTHASAPPSAVPEADADEIARLQAQVAALTETVARLQTQVETLTFGNPALASVAEESKAPPGRYYSASYADSVSESTQQKVAAAESVALSRRPAADEAIPSDFPGSGENEKSRLLDQLGIRGSKRKALEATATYAQALAWTLYAATQPGLTRNKVGYVVQRLAEGEPAPAEFSALALPPEAITLFRRAVRYGGPYCQAIPSDMTALFQDWKRRFPLTEVPAGTGPRRACPERSRRGRAWDPPPSIKVDSLEDLLGSAEVEPVAAWAAACDALAGQVPDDALATLRRCSAWQGGDPRCPKISLGLPDDDPPAGAVIFTQSPLDAPQLAGGRKADSPVGEFPVAKGKKQWYS